MTKPEASSADSAALLTKRDVWPIFISYRRSDTARIIALELKKELEASTIEAAPGQIFTLDVFVDVAEAHQPDFQANLVPHLKQSRALIVLADDGSASRKVDGSVDYLYAELDWWARRKKTPPIILQMGANAGSRLVADAQFSAWRKVSFMDCFWEKWTSDEKVGYSEKAQLLGWLRKSIREYGVINQLEEVRRLKRRAFIASVFAGVALVAAAVAIWMGLLANKNAETARAQSDRSMALALSAQSREVLGKNDQRGLLLAAEAVRQTAMDGYTIPAARQALQQVLSRVSGVGLSGHTDHPTLGEFSDDEKLLATAAFNKEVRVWNVSDPLAPKCSHILSLPENAKSVVFDSGGKNLVTLSRTGSTQTQALVWQLREGERYPASRPLTTDGIDDAMAVSPTAALLAVARGSGQIDIFALSDLSDPKVLRSLRAPQPNSITALSFSKDGQVLMAGTETSHVWIWDLAADRQVPVTDIDADHQARRPNMERVPIDVLGISDDHTLLYTASSYWFDNSGWADLDLKLWRLRDLHSVDQPIILPHRGASNSSAIKIAKFTGDGSHLVTTSLDGWVRSWPLSQILSGKTDVPEANFHSAHFAESGDISPDESLLAFSSGNEVCLLQMPDWMSSSEASVPVSLPGFDGSVEFVHFSPKGRFLVAGGLGNAVRIWDLRSNDPTAPVNVLSPSPYAPAKDTYLDKNGEFGVVLRHSNLEFWNLHDPFAPQLAHTEILDETRAKEIAECLPCRVLTSSSHRWAAIQSTSDDQAEIVELCTSGRRFVVPARVWRNTDEIQFSEDGRWLFVEEKGGLETIYDLQTPKPAIPVRTVVDLPAGSYSRELPPGGRLVLYKRFVNSYHDHTGREQIVGVLAPIDLVNEKSRMLRIDGFATGIGRVTFSDDGVWMALAGEMKWGDRQKDDKVVKVFRLDDVSAAALTFNEQEFAANPKISGNGRWLLTASDDITLRDSKTLARLYRIDSGGRSSKAQVLSGVTTYLHAVQFSPDGRFLVTISGGGPTARLWRLNDSGAVLAATLAIPGQQLNWHWAIAFSGDGESLVIYNTSDNSMPYLWRLTSPYISNQGTPIPNGDRAIKSAHFDTKGKRLILLNSGITAGGVSGSSGSHVTVVELSQFPREGSTYSIDVPAHTEAVAYRPDSKLLMCAGDSFQCRWVELEQLMRNAECAVGRNLTLDEWIKSENPKVYRPTFPRLGVDGKTLTSLSGVVERLRKEKPKEARQLISNLIAWTIEHDEAEVCNSVGWNMALQLDGQNALDAVSGALAHFPDTANYRDTRGVAFALLGRHEDAIADFKFFVKAEASNPLETDNLEQRRKWIHALRDGTYPFKDGIN